MGVCFCFLLKGCLALPKKLWWLLFGGGSPPPFTATVQDAVQLVWPTASCLKQNTNFQNRALEESVER